MVDPKEGIEKLRDRIKDSDEITEADAAALLDFSDELYLRKTETGYHRHAKLLRHCVRIAENVGGLHDALTDKDAAKTILNWIHRTYDNEETNRDYRVAVRMFGRRTTEDGGDHPPESIAWIPSGTSSSYNPKPDPAEMLGWEDHVKPMIDATLNTRDAAMIALQWDAGLRGGEFHELRVGDLADHDYGMQITVDGKRGQRTVTLIPSVPYIQKWLADHPGREDPTAPLWSKLTTNEAVSKRTVYQAFNNAAERAEINVPVTLTNFRKSSASYAASEGMSQAHLEARYGWVRGSDAAARYVAVFGEAGDRELAKIHGKDVEDIDEESGPDSPVTCPRCNKETPGGEDFCVWCDQALSRGAIERMEQDLSTVQRDFLQFAKDNPDILDEADRREELITELADDGEFLERAQEFVDALESH